MPNLLDFGQKKDIYQKLPKVELHRHLEGSLRVATLRDIARQHKLTLPLGDLRLDRQVQVQADEPYTFENFLAKFNVLRLFYRSPEVIQRITSEAIEDAAKDNIKYMELRFTPVALSRAERFPLHEVMDWVCASAQQAARKLSIGVNLIASVNRHESAELAEQVAWLSADRIAQGIVGLDLAGNEAQFSAEPFKGIFAEAKQSGLSLTVHAGEWAGAENVREAIEVLQAERIGHGVRVLEDTYTIALARERQTAFEVCLTSNHQTGAVPAIEAHPCEKMLAAGLNVTINTDDPGVSQITLSDEYRVFVETLNLSLETLKEKILAAADASFQKETERKRLQEQLIKQLK